MSILIFDTETSGLPDKNYSFKNVRMLELGYIILDDDYNIILERNFISNIEMEVPEIITKLTGITSEILIEKGIDIKEILSIFVKDLKDIDILIAHNNRFDLAMIREEFKKIGAENIFEKKIYNKINLDSLQIFRKMIGKKEIKNYKLQTIYKYYHKDDFVQTHRALDDCKILQSSLVNIKDNFNVYDFYLNKSFNFKKYPRQNLKKIYENDPKYVLNFLKRIPISKKIFKFL